MTTYVSYEPPRREFADTMLAFKDFEMASSWGARIAPDPLGPVNKIISVMYGGRRVGKAVLWHVPAGAVVKLVRVSDGYTIDELFALREQFYKFGRDAYSAPNLSARRAAGWAIEVDGREVLYVPDSEIWPPTPVAPVPWRLRAVQRVRTRLQGWGRAVGDRVASRFGYVHESEARDW